MAKSAALARWAGAAKNLSGCGGVHRRHVGAADQADLVLGPGIQVTARTSVFDPLAAFGFDRLFFVFAGLFDRHLGGARRLLSQVIMKPRVSSFFIAASKGPSGMM